VRGLGHNAKAALGIVAVIAVTGVLIGFYVVGFLMSGPTPYRPSASANRTVDLTIETVPAAGSTLTANPDWVSYFIRDDQTGHWLHTTIWELPAHATIHVTVYQFDTSTGLRNPFMSKVRGTVGDTMQVNGRTLSVLNPNLASHTFAVPALSLIVPFEGVADDAKNQCAYGPCGLASAHQTITFTFRTPGPGRYRWQCFVPCAAGFIDGFGGPMSTLGYMDGFLNVS
jgi:hypothetical protein